MLKVSDADDGNFHELLEGWGIKIRNKSLQNIFINESQKNIISITPQVCTLSFFINSILVIQLNAGCIFIKINKK